VAKKVQKESRLAHNHFFTATKSHIQDNEGTKKRIQTLVSLLAPKTKILY
jgi:hypothetical protein